MRRWIAAAISILVLAGANAWAADAPKVTVKPVLSTTTTASGQPVTVPANPQVIVSTYDIPVGAVLPFHKHPFQRYAYVMAGDLSVVNRDTSETYRYKTGDFIVEVLDQWHMGRNEGKTPVKLLVIDQVEPGKPNVVMAPTP
ncbi:MAG: cupin domain-containing protein [Alphaproteobacteria bacterium]